VREKTSELFWNRRGFVMNDKDFIKAVYQKYEKYQQEESIQFVKTRFHKKTRPLFLTVLILIVFMVFMLGATAATYYFSGIWKVPEKYDYTEDSKVTEQLKSEVLSEQALREKAKEYLSILLNESDTVETVCLLHDPSENKTRWEVKTEQGHFLYLDGFTGKLERFSSVDIQEEFADASKKEAEQAGDALIERLGYNVERYSEKQMIDDGKGRWWINRNISYDGIVNPYQGIRMLFSPKEQEILVLTVFDAPFENNPYLVAEDEAIKIVEFRLNSNVPSKITAHKSIEKMNAQLYQKENEGTYRTEGLVRNVWKVSVENATGFEEYYFVDGTTGELIGGDQTK